MSVCVSSHGEYSAHEPGEETARFVCQLCRVFDEDAALARIAELEASPLTRLLRDAKVLQVQPDDVLLIGNVDCAENISEAFDQLRQLWPERRVVMFAGEVDVQKISRAALDEL